MHLSTLYSRGMYSCGMAGHEHNTKVKIKAVI